MCNVENNFPIRIDICENHKQTMTILKLTKILILLSWIPLCFIYYNSLINYSFTSAKVLAKNHYSVKKIDTIIHGKENYLMNTPGCTIPNYGKTFKLNETNILNKSCGKRAIFVKKLANNKIEFKIDQEKMKIYSLQKTYYCCVRFATPQIVSGKINLKKLEYTSCATFLNGSKVDLEQEILTVSCYSKSTSIYEDAYLVLKKIKRNKDVNDSEMDSWNILVVGMDTMSRTRLMASMPKTAQYLREHNWLDFRAYHKVGYNTFPNLMSLLTGKNVSTMYSACSKGLDKCSKYLLWNKFKEAGYTTAYGEDDLQLPDTFNKYDGFKIPPTDHYMRPFFLTGETIQGNYVCAKRMPSANHILDYAYQFSDVYKKNKFYGFFWINSCSHNTNNNPTLFDKDFVSFFDQMYKEGVMENTFILFISDHGIRFGNMRFLMESYYEERLPMSYIWVPKKFKELFPEKYTNLQLNQKRLVTPYDLYLTMGDILQTSRESNEVITSEACPLCNSLFEEVSDNRTCTDAGIDEKWCSCHNMIPVDKNKIDVIRSLEVITEQLENKRNSTKTKECTECYKFKIKTTLRSHSYEDTAQNKTYFVVAVITDPGEVGYEAIVQKQSGQYSLVPFMDTITGYNSKGTCVVNPNDRGFCVCKTTCKKKVKRKTSRDKGNFITQNINR